MHPDYQDITSKLGDPIWYYNQKAAIPRYLPFHPEWCGVYDEVAALTVIRCQCCHREFFASVSYSQMDRCQRNAEGKFQFEDIILPTADDPGWFDVWGDPPRHGKMGLGSCAAGDTMTSEMVRIAEFWVREQVNGFPEWKRKPEYEFDYTKLLGDED